MNFSRGVELATTARFGRYLVLSAALVVALVLPAEPGRVPRLHPGRTAEAAGPATHLAFLSHPDSAARGAAFPSQPVVAVLDADDEVVTADNTTLITLPNALSCTGGLTRQVVNGVATFMGCTTKQLVHAWFNATLQTTSNTGLTPATSNPYFTWDPLNDVPGLLRVTTTPALPSQIQVNGFPMDDWGLNWAKVPPGLYTVSFSDLPGFTAPAPQTVTVTAGQVTTVQGTFVQRGNLRVVTSPPVASTISVDGVPRNDWGLWTDLPLGSYEVCFGPVAGRNTPPCQQANLVAGQTTVITGAFTTNAGAPGPTAGYGMLRVQTSPAVPSQIKVDGVPMTDWGLDWVKLAPGTYTVSFGDVSNFTTPPPQVVTVIAEQTTVVSGTFAQRGFLRGITNPPVPGTITVNGVPREDWGMWTSVEPGAYTVCFGAILGFEAVPCQNVNVSAGALTTATGSYATSSCVPVAEGVWDVQGSSVFDTVFGPYSWNACPGQQFEVIVNLKVAATSVDVFWAAGYGVDGWTTEAVPMDETNKVWSSGTIWPGGATLHQFRPNVTYGNPSQTVFLGIALCSIEPC